MPERATVLIGSNVFANSIARVYTRRISTRTRTHVRKYARRPSAIAHHRHRRVKPNYTPRGPSIISTLLLPGYRVASSLSLPLSLSLSRDIRGLEPRIGKTRGLTVGRAIFRRLWEKRGANARKRDSPRTEDAGGGGGRRKKKRGRR